MARRRLTHRQQMSEYAREIGRARTWRENEGYDELWRALVELYQGKNLFPKARMQDEDRIAINIAFSTLNVIFPSVSVNNPKIGVLANRPENEDRAVFNEAIINYQWGHYDFQEPFRFAVKDFLIVGHGWTKVMWEFSETERDYDDDEFTEEFVAELQTERSLPEEERRSDEEIARGIIDSMTFVQADQPVVERISPHDMFVNPEAKSLKLARWVAQRVIRHIDDVREDDAYDRAERSKVAAGLRHTSSMDTSHQREDSPNDLCEIWEFYDLSKGTMCIFSEGSAGYLVKPRKMPYHFGHPYVMARNYDVPDMFYPIGDLEQIAPLVMELSKTRSAMMNYRARYARKYLVRQSALRRGDEQKLTSKRDGETIMIQDESVPLQDVVAPVPQTPIDASLFNWGETISNDVMEVSGVSEYARGGGGAIRRTATEAALIQDATNARSADKLAIVEGFIANIGRKVLQVNQQFLTGDQVARIVGKEGQMIWLPYTRNDIIGEYDFAVEAGSTQPQNEAARRQNAMSLASVSMPFIQLGLANPVEVFRHLLQEGFGIRNPEKFISQQAAGGQPMLPGQEQQAGAPPEGGVGVDAPQPSPEERRDADAAAQDPAIAGVPAGAFNQLAGQMGLN